MNKALSVLAIAFLLAGCMDPSSPFYTGEGNTTKTEGGVVEGVKEAVTGEEVATDETPNDEATAEETDAATEEVASKDQCLTSDVLANVTYAVIPKGTKGTVEKSGGKEYFVTGGKKHDVTNVPYGLTSC